MLLLKSKHSILIYYENINKIMNIEGGKEKNQRESKKRKISNKI